VKEFGGWQFPDGEEHLTTWMAKANHQVGGRLSYQYRKIEIALAHVRNFRVAVDVGAHIGLWSWHLAPRFGAVKAFEPIPSHAECFQVNVVAPNVDLHQCALAGQAGYLRFYRCPGNSGHTHVSVDGDTECPARTLDSFNFQVVDFLKIDCEGYEREVVAGAVETLKRCKPTIIVEQKSNFGSLYGYGNHAGLELLKSMGAKLVAEKAGDYVLTW
jgi:FkbM family methyltransferase